MGFLSGLGNLFGVGGAGTAAKNAGKSAKWMPPSINLNGAQSTFDVGNIKKGIPGSVSASLSPTQQSFYDSLGGLATNAIGQLNQSGGAPAVPGYAGISPELYNEFNLSNQYAQNPYGSVGNIYQPNVSNMGNVRGASYDGSGLPQVSGINTANIPQVSGVDASGMPMAGANVNWSGKASGLDQAYLDKSKAFLGASAPVTGFDGLATDWYNSLRQLSQDDQNNMLAGAGDKQFLRGMLGSETGNGYNPAMKAAFSAYSDQDLKDKLAGYNVAADASQRNLQQGLAAGGFVQQNDQTRLQQAMAQGQLDASTSIANSGNWLNAQGLNMQAQSQNAGNWLTGQGMNMQAQGQNANNWLSSQGMNLQAQGMNQNADSQNIANYLQAQGMLTDASGLQANRDVAANAQTLQQNAFNFDRSNARFQNAQNMFNTGQNTINAEQARLMQMLAAGAGGMQGYDSMLAGMAGLQGNLGSAQSGANLGAGQLRTGYDLSQQGMWGSMFNAATEAAGNAISDRRLKTDIQQIGTTPAGYPWYKFNYVWGEPSEGVMADEVPAEWVSYNDKGFASVNYAKVK